MIKAIHFLNSGGGGTLSVVQNILRFSKSEEVEHHVIYTINKAITPEFEPLNLAGAAGEQVFFYSANWNFYYTCRRLALLLPSSDAVLVAHDWLELGMASMLGLPNPVVQFLHGDFYYYYDLAAKHKNAIDRFIVVSPVIERTLKEKLVERSGDVKYCRFPVPELKSSTNSHSPLRIVYCVKNLLDERKQFQIIPAINKWLKKFDMIAEWTIVGQGIPERELKLLMGQHEYMHCYQSLHNDEVLTLLQHQDLFILPSLSEGFPVSVVEAMKGGAVPLIRNWNGATSELVRDAETGYCFQENDPKIYAERIVYLNENREILKQMSLLAVESAKTLFEPINNTSVIENVFQEAARDCLTGKHPQRLYGSRLDQKWIPNMITSGIRNLAGNRKHNPI
ncbi:MAG: glycosyltransferase [Ferruginibacter sp.]|nr:glycosyltransferase [Ferruginibacter sp.]